MHSKKITTLSFFHAFGILIYIGLVALLMNNGSRLFGHEDTILTAIAMLLLFTISAAIVGLLVFGRPVMLYLNGQKKEAVQFTLATIGFLMIEALIFFIFMFAMNL